MIPSAVQISSVTRVNIIVTQFDGSNIKRLLKY